MERAGSDEEDVIRSHHAVLGVDGGALDDRQDVALNAFATDVGSVAAFAARNLVDFVEEDDAGLLHALDGESAHLLHVDQLLLFFLCQRGPRLLDRHALLLRLALGKGPASCP